MGCGGGVFICIQVLYVLGQPSVHHTIHVCTNLHMYICMCTQVHVHTYTTYTRFEKYSCITIVSRVDIKMFLKLKFNKTANLSHCNYSMSTVNLPNNSKQNRTTCTRECIHINSTHLDRSVDTDSGVEGGGVSSSSPTVVATTSGLLATHKQE